MEYLGIGRAGMREALLGRELNVEGKENWRRWTACSVKRILCKVMDKRLRLDRFQHCVGFPN